MYISVQSIEGGGAPVVKLKCPHCGHNGTFEQIAADILAKDQRRKPFLLGQRRCPNDACRGHIFFILDSNDKLHTYPAQRIDFEKADIPKRVLDAFAEALECHANKCYVAAGMMIRKTLEEICLDRGATGDDLKKKIRALGTKIVIPHELLEGMDDLRLLGNDAAHIESKTFEQVSQTEIEVAAEFTKEILKAVYQYQHLLDKLRGLKKSAT